jgi:hypothetical protein
MANWNLLNAPSANMVINSGNIGSSIPPDSYISWPNKDPNDYILYINTPGLTVQATQEYQLEFYYATDGIIELEVAVYDANYDTNDGYAAGIRFTMTLPDTLGMTTHYSAIVQSGAWLSPSGTVDPVLAGKMVIKHKGTAVNNSSLDFDNFKFQQVIGYQVTSASALPNWEFLNTVAQPWFIPGPGALDFTTYADQIWFPSGPDVFFNMSAVLSQQTTMLSAGQTYSLTMNINNDLAASMNSGAGPPMSPYSGGLFVSSTNAEYDGTVVSRVPITEDNGIGTAIWKQTYPNQVLAIGMEPGYEALIDNIVLKTVFQTSGTVTNWNLLDGGNSMELFWTPDDLGSEEGSVVFDTPNPDIEINQVIDGANIFAGDEFRITFNVTGYVGGEVNGYLYNDEGKGFVFGPISSNGLHTFNYVVSQSMLGTSTANNMSRIGLVSGANGFEGKIDNMSLENLGGGKTLSFGEDIKGWASFKSFIPDLALSVSGQYYTTNRGQLYQHHREFEVDGVTPINRNNFYGEDFESSITPILNMQPGMVKNFNTLNYEGSQSKVDLRHDDNNFHNLQPKDGWYVSDIHTDKQEGSLNEFIEKEGKWFNYIKGLSYQVDTSAFNFQGIGVCGQVWPGEPVPMELQILQATPGNDNGAARIVYASTSETQSLGIAGEPVGAFGEGFAWSNGTITNPTSGNTLFPLGLPLGPISVTVTDHLGNLTSYSGFVMTNFVNGCTNPAAINYDWTANTDDGSCII